MAVDSSGNVYVADYRQPHDPQSDARRGGDDAGRTARAVRGSADGTGSAARFDYPTGVAVDGAGNVYVADYVNHTIRKVTTAGGGDDAGRSWRAVLAARTGRGAPRGFSYPHGVAVDSAGNVYVADTFNHTIRKVTRAGW